MAGGRGRQRVGYLMPTGHPQGDLPEDLAIVLNIKAVQSERLFEPAGTPISLGRESKRGDRRLSCGQGLNRRGAIRIGDDHTVA